MTWTVRGTRLDSIPFGTLEPQEVLYEFDGPQIYVAADNGRPLFVYESDSDDVNGLRRLLVVPTSTEIIAGLKTGALSLCDALRQPWLHVVDQRFDGRVVASWHLDDGLDSVPDGYKPVEGTLLSVELEQALRYLSGSAEAQFNQATAIRTLQFRKALRSYGQRNENPSGNFDYDEFSSSVLARLHRYRSCMANTQEPNAGDFPNTYGSQDFTEPTNTDSLNQVEELFTEQISKIRRKNSNAERKWH